MIIRSIPALLVTIICINSLYSSTLLSQTFSNDSLKWPGAADSAFQKLKNGNLSEAAAIFDNLTSEPKFKYYGYYGLGLVELAKDSLSEEAEDYFTKVIRMPNNLRLKNRHVLARSQYEMGNIQFAIGDTSDAYYRWDEAVVANEDCLVAWLKLASLEILEEEPSEFSVDVFGNLLRLGYYKKEYYDAFLKNAYWYSKEKLAVEYLTKIYLRSNNDPKFIFDLAEFYYKEGEFKESLAWCDSIKAKNPEFSTTKLYALYAKNYFCMNNVFGFPHYVTALQTIKDQQDAEYIFSDLYYLMKDEEFVVLQNTPIDSLYIFYKRFWLFRDPDKSTEINERISEHFIRLQYAQSHYRKYTKSYTKKEAADDNAHPYWKFSNNISGEELLDKHLPSVFNIERDVNDMGIIYIKHGQPDFILNNIFGIENSESISWQYYETKDTPEMIFHFSKYSGMRSWKLQTLPATFAGTSVFGAMYTMFDPENIPDLSYMDFKNQNLPGEIPEHSPARQVNVFGSYRRNDPSYEKYLYEISDENEKIIEYAVNHESTNHDYKERKLSFYLQPIFFKDDNGLADIDFFYALNGDNLDLDTTGILNFKKFIGIYDNHYDETKRIIDSDKLRLNVDEDEWEESAIMRCEETKLPAGHYSVEFQLKETYNDRRGVDKFTMDVPDFYNNLSVSDIVISKPINVADNSGKYERNGISYLPHFYKAYNQDYELGLYFEIYNLKNINNNTQFDLSFIIKLRDRDEALESFDSALIDDYDEDEYLKMTNEYTGSSSDDFIYLNIDIESLDEGVYDLFIRVKDKQTNKTADQKTVFAIWED